MGVWVGRTSQQTYSPSAPLTTISTGNSQMKHWGYHVMIWACFKMNLLCPTTGIPNPWPADWYWSVALIETGPRGKHAWAPPPDPPQFRLLSPQPRFMEKLFPGARKVALPFKPLHYKILEPQPTSSNREKIIEYVVISTDCPYIKAYLSG